MFSQFGKILDVVCLKTYRLRGQAWIVFSDVAAATNALRMMQGFPFMDKPIVSRLMVNPANISYRTVMFNGAWAPSVTRAAPAAKHMLANVCATNMIRIGQHHICFAISAFCHE